MATEPHGQIAAAPHGRVSVSARRPDAAGPGLRLGILRAESGTATIEFCLAFPIALFLALILVQFTLLMVGNQYVHYAAFAATRSAIVYVPQDYTGEPRNTIIPEKGRTKFDAIRAAAYLAVAPVCGKLEETSEDLRTDEYVAGLETYFASYGQDPPRWVDTLAAARLRYAAENTEVRVLETDVLNEDVEFFDIAGEFDYYTFGPREPVTILIEHKLNLSVPYVRAIFADGEHPNGGRYALVTAQYTLTNEGMNTELPDLPDLPRNPE